MTTLPPAENTVAAAFNGPEQYDQWFDENAALYRAGLAGSWTQAAGWWSVPRMRTATRSPDRAVSPATTPTAAGMP